MFICETKAPGMWCILFLSFFLLLLSSSFTPSLQLAATPSGAFSWWWWKIKSYNPCPRKNFGIFYVRLYFSFVFLFFSALRNDYALKKYPFLSLKQPLAIPSGGATNFPVWWLDLRGKAFITLWFREGFVKIVCREALWKSFFFYSQRSIWPRGDYGCRIGDVMAVELVLGLFFSRVKKTQLVLKIYLKVVGKSLRE